MTPAKGHLPFLDVTRGIAIILVLFFHSAGSAFGIFCLPWHGLGRDFQGGPDHFLWVLPATIGHVGVAIFFAVSGFCIHLSHIRSQETGYSCFYIRRFFRIYPPYLCALLFFALLLPTTRVNWFSPQGSLQVFYHSLLIHNWTAESFFGLNPSFWSIAVEIQLYLVYPLLIVVVRKLGWIVTITGLGVVEIGGRLATSHLAANTGAESPVWIIGNPLYFGFSWSIGAWLADAWLRSTTLPFQRIPPALPVLAGIAADFFRPACELSFVLFSVATVAAIARHLAHGEQADQRKKPLPRLLIFIGSVSYSLYLFHQPILNLLPRIYRRICEPGIGMYGLLLASLPLLIGLSAMMHRYVESPTSRWGRRFCGPKRQNEVRFPFPITKATDCPNPSEIRV